MSAHVIDREEEKRNPGLSSNWPNRHQSLQEKRRDDSYNRIVFLTGRVRTVWWAGLYTRAVSAHEVNDFVLGPAVSWKEQSRDADLQRHDRIRRSVKNTDHVRSCVIFCFSSKVSITNRWLMRLNCLPFCCVWTFHRHYNYLLRVLLRLNIMEMIGNENLQKS